MASTSPNGNVFDTDSLSVLAGAVLAAARQSWLLPAAATALGVLLGGLAVTLVQNLRNRNQIREAMPRYPRDWPKRDEIFASDPSEPGYLRLTGKKVLRSKTYAGALRLGILYPRWPIYRLIPRWWPLTRLREWLMRKTAPEVWVPAESRVRHMAVLGATGTGKTTRYAWPALTYGSREKDTAYLAIDVKTPTFVRTFSPLYKAQGKNVYFFDPWQIHQTEAFEPLWRATEEELNEIAEVVSSYSKHGDVQASSNSEFFDDAGRRVMRGLLELAQFWPRRFCNLPCVQQLSVAGADKVVDAFQTALKQIPSAEEIVAAAEVAISASTSDLRASQREEGTATTEALTILDRAGHEIARMVRNMRAIHRRHEAGQVNDADYDRAMRRFRRGLEVEADRRRRQLEKLIEAQGEFIEMAPETRGSVMSTLTNKLAWFTDTNVAKAFSRDELDLDVIVSEPCLFIVGAPMGKLNVGSLFVASILTNLGINKVFQRGSRMEAGEKVWPGQTHFLLDEFPQLNIRKASQALATFRGFRAGLFIIYQDRGQLKQLYKEDATNIEANCVHDVLMRGAHPDTCRFYSDAMGEVPIVTRSESGQSGEKKNVSTSVQRVKLMDARDIHDMRFNGRARPEAALSVGGETPAFPIIPVAFWDDPVVRKMLRMKRRLIRKGMPWQWRDRWEVQTRADNVHVYRRPRDRYDPNDPVGARLEDPYAQYVEYLIGPPTQTVVRDGTRVAERIYDELEVPDLKLGEITSGQGGGAGGGFGGFGMPPSGNFPPPPPKPPKKKEPQKAQDRPPSEPASSESPAGVASRPLVPVYGDDLKDLLADDLEGPVPVPSEEPPTGSIIDRIEGES